jgi:hypothetical protein
MISALELKEYQDGLIGNAFVELSSDFCKKFEDTVKRRLDQWPYVKQITFKLTDEEYQVRTELKKWIVSFGYDVSYNESEFTITIEWK